MPSSLSSVFRGSAGATILAALLVACGGGEPTHAGPADGMQVVASPADRDTIDARPASTLTVSVASGGAYVRNAAVTFAAVLPPGCELTCAQKTGMGVTRVRGTMAGVYSNQATDTTGSDGRASVRVAFAEVAGSATIRITAPALGLEQTVTFTVAPGAGTTVRILPGDTVVYRNTTSQLHPVVLDRHGNARPDAPTLTAEPGLSVAGLSVTADAYGIAAVRASYPGATDDLIHVSVVPRGTLAAVGGPQGQAIEVFDLDGSNRHTLDMGTQVHGMDWAPGGSRLTASLGAFEPPHRLYSVSLDGSRSELFPGAHLADALAPAYSADGRWLYFIGSPPESGGEIWRARADGSELERVGPASPFAVVVAPSPDGSRVAYTSDFDASAVRIVDAATGATAVYAHPAGGVRWSPQGGRLAIAGESGTGVLNADGTGYHALAPGSAIADYSVAWSPDGEWIAIRGRTRIELVQVATGLDIPLPFTDGYTRPAWKP